MVKELLKRLEKGELVKRTYITERIELYREGYQDTVYERDLVKAGAAGYLTGLMHGGVIDNKEYDLLLAYITGETEVDA